MPLWANFATVAAVGAICGAVLALVTFGRLFFLDGYQAGYAKAFEQLTGHAPTRPRNGRPGRAPRPIR